MGKWNHVLPKSVTPVLGNPIGFVVTITYYEAASSITETFVLAYFGHLVNLIGRVRAGWPSSVPEIETAR